MITIKSPKEIAVMKEGGRILAKIMKELTELVEPGVTTKYLNKVAEDLVLRYGASPSFLNHDGFPAVLCVSINEEIVHCLPSDRKLKERDIISLDLGVYFKGFHTDMALTIAVGKKIEPKVLELIKAAEDSLLLAIKKIKPGINFSEIGRVVQGRIESGGFGVVRELCGHGIGKAVHEEPQILNFEEKEKGLIIKEGMVFCVEPMATAGDWRIKLAKDGYGYETRDGSLSAHFEHTIAVTKNGCEVLTKV